MDAPANVSVHAGLMTETSSGSVPVIPLDFERVVVVKVKNLSFPLNAQPLFPPFRHLKLMLCSLNTLGPSSIRYDDILCFSFPLLLILWSRMSVLRDSLDLFASPATGPI